MKYSMLIVMLFVVSCGPNFVDSLSDNDDGGPAPQTSVTPKVSSVPTPGVTPSVTPSPTHTPSPTPSPSPKPCNPHSEKCE